MPRIELIPEVYYNPNDPYHWEYDNLPLKNIIRRQNLINMALDNLIAQVQDAIGTQGSISNRLNQSIAADGSLKVAAIDEALHSIEAHEDTDDYVRMTRSESDKLDLIDDEATSLSVLANDYDTDDMVAFSTGQIEFLSSSTVTIDVDSPNKLRWNMKFPAEAAHSHYYDIVPVHANLSSPDYINFKSTSTSTEFMEGTLRVYVNGVRLSAEHEVYVPGHLVDDPWTLIQFTPDHETGTFELSHPISDDDFIMIDFDVQLV